MPSQRSWFRRNWKWFVPGMFVVAVAMAGIAVVGYVQIRSYGYRQNPAYQFALSVVQASEEVQTRLGSPIEDSDWNPQGEYDKVGETIRAAQFNFTVSGPNGEADVAVQSSQIAGEWAVNGLTVRFSNDERVALTEEALAKQKIDTPEFDPQSEQNKQTKNDTSQDSPPPPDVSVDVPDVPAGVK
jgi:hypothetical protein